jgi:hypothetical protein
MDRDDRVPNSDTIDWEDRIIQAQRAIQYAITAED